MSDKLLNVLLALTVAIAAAVLICVECGVKQPPLKEVITLEALKGNPNALKLLEWEHNESNRLESIYE